MTVGAAFVWAAVAALTIHAVRARPEEYPELFKEGRRGGSAYAHLMEPVVARLTPGQIEDVALFFESLGR